MLVCEKFFRENKSEIYFSITPDSGICIQHGKISISNFNLVRFSIAYANPVAERTLISSYLANAAVVSLPNETISKTSTCIYFNRNSNIRVKTDLKSIETEKHRIKQF